MILIKNTVRCLIIIVFYCGGSLTMEHHDSGASGRQSRALVHAGVFYASDFSLYAAQRLFHPAQRVLGVLPSVCSAGVNSLAHVRPYARMYLAIASLATIGGGEHASHLRRLLVNPYICGGAVVLGSDEPERELHRLGGQVLADAVVPIVDEPAVAISGNSRSLARYRTIKSYVLLARCLLDFGDMVDIHVPVPRLYEALFFPEFFSHVVGTVVDGCREHLGLRTGSLSDLVMSYTAEQIRRDLPNLIVWFLDRIDTRIERALASPENESH